MKEHKLIANDSYEIKYHCNQWEVFLSIYKSGETEKLKQIMLDRTWDIKSQVDRIIDFGNGLPNLIALSSDEVCNQLTILYPQA